MPGFDVAKTGVPQISVETSDITINVEPYPTEVKSGRNISLYFDAANKHLDMGITNFSLSVYDMCAFGSGTLDIWKNVTIDSNRTKSESVSLKAGDVDFDNDCVIKFMADYVGKVTKTQSVAVLTESEYYQKEQAGKLGEIPMTSTSTSNPLSILLSFSEGQPFISGEENYMYIDYSYSGDGYIDKISVDSIKIRFPNNMKNVSCNDYSSMMLYPDTGLEAKGTVNCAGSPIPCESIKPATGFNCGQYGCSDDYKGGCSGINQKTCKQLGDSTNGVDYCLSAGCAIEHTLAREKTFINKQATRSTCTFIANASQPIDSKTLMLEGTYKYSLDNSILVKVKPR